jgi:alkylhydroperoxidase/carboxymuconolactone decarboxylase family protein YurZ
VRAEAPPKRRRREGGEASSEMFEKEAGMHVHERNAEKRRLNGVMLKSSMKAFPVFGDLGRKIFADGALSKKHKELTALAVAVSKNCFD